jgi:hypothetical protein
MVLFTDVKLTAIALVLAIAATLGAQSNGTALFPLLDSEPQSQGPNLEQTFGPLRQAN